MSVLPQELLRKISPNAKDFSEHAQSAEIPDERFQKLLQVQPIDEKLDDTPAFSLFEQEEEEELSALPQALPHPMLPPAPAEKKESRQTGSAATAFSPVKLKEKESPFCDAPCVAPFLLQNGGTIVSAASANAPVLSPEIEAVFEKMASSMIIMTSSHEVETTFFLDNPQFASSVLFGTKITIREFSTAPKAFNIEIASNPNALSVIDASKIDLMSAFEKANFNFTVHRFDTAIQQSEDRPVLHRKESNDKGQQDQKGGRGQ
jgi:hypothetical protein